MAGSGQSGQAWQKAYEIVDEIGSGGVAHVYRARDKRTGETVALKVMREELHLDPEVRERLRREALAVKSIASPHVCAVYDFDTTEREAYIVMEYVEGPTLRDIVKSFPWDIDDIATVVGQIGEALYSAHQLGIIHRDLKPENIMLSGFGDTAAVKVLDFGFAKLIANGRGGSEDEELTEVGSCFGTPQYMSPEQIRGRELGPSSDLFALAAMAYEIVAGQRPWNGKSPHAVMVAVAQKPPPAITSPRAGLQDRGAELDAFFARALAKDPQDRPQTARELCLGLRVAMGMAADVPFEDPREWFDEVTMAVINLKSVPRLPVEAAAEPEDAAAERLQSQWFSTLERRRTQNVEVQDVADFQDTLADEAPPKVIAQMAAERSRPTRVRAVTAPVHIPVRRSDKRDNRWLWTVLGIVIGMSAMAALSWAL